MRPISLHTNSIMNIEWSVPIFIYQHQQKFTFSPYTSWGMWEIGSQMIKLDLLHISSIPHNSKLNPGRQDLFFLLRISLPSRIFGTLYVPFATLHGLFKLYLIVFSLFGLTSRAWNCSVIDFSFTAFKGPNMPLHGSLKLWLLLSRFIRPYLPPQELFRYGFLPHGSIMLTSSPNAPLPPLIQTSLLRIPIHISFTSLNVPNAPFPGVLLLFLTLAYFSPFSSLVPLHLIQPWRMHYLNEQYSSLLSRGWSIRWWCVSLSIPHPSTLL